MNVTRIRVVLADDDLLVREGLTALLERSSFEVVGQAGTSHELLDQARAHRPELAIVDTRMPPTQTNESLEAAAVILRKSFRTARSSC